MKEPLSGNKLLVIAMVILCGIIVAALLIKFFVLLLQRIFPKYEVTFENFYDKIDGPLSATIRQSLYGIVFLFIIRFIAGWLGWGPPLY